MSSRGYGSDGEFNPVTSDLRTAEFIDAQRGSMAYSSFLCQTGCCMVRSSGGNFCKLGALLLQPQPRSGGRGKPAIYNDVGAVKEKIRDTSPEDAERPVKGARRAFIWTLDRTFRSIQSKRERSETKFS